MASNGNGRRGNAGGPQDQRARGLPGTPALPGKPPNPATGTGSSAPSEFFALGELYAGDALPWSALMDDAVRFAREMLLVGGAYAPAGSPLRTALTALAERGRPDDFRRAAEACHAEANAPKAKIIRMLDASARLDYYAAATGCRNAAMRVAARAVHMADSQAETDGEALDLAVAALGWLATSAEPPHDPEDRSSRSMAASAGERVFDRMASAWRERLAERDGPPRNREEDCWSLDELLRPPGGVGVKSAGTAGVVVVPGIGGQQTAEGRRVLEAYGDLVGAELPLVPVPDIGAIRRTLSEDYPHATSVIGAVCDELAGRGHVHLRPIILVGAPGCGKTSFAEDLMGALGLRHALYPCGGTGDAALAGNPRRWITGEPSMPVALMSSHRTASPGIVLDELEKAGVGRQNGALQDALLGMLEPRTASRWLDPYLQAPVDLSHLLWVATANSLDGISPALRDRFRVVRFPEPGAVHLPALGNRLLRSALQDRGIDGRWALPLDGTELAALAGAWRGGSLRRLARLVAGVLAERDRAPGVN